MSRFFESPEAAARSDDPGGAVSEVRLVSRSPDERHAVVLIDYNRSEPYAVFCERRAAGWVASIGIGAGDNTSLGNAEADVQTTWDPPSAIWGIPGPSRLTDEFLEGDE